MNKPVVVLAVLAMILALIVLVPSCGETSGLPPRVEAPPAPPAHDMKVVQSTRWTNPDIFLIEVDGCEYVGISDSGGGVALVHKANCKNPIHLKESK